MRYRLDQLIYISGSAITSTTTSSPTVISVSWLFDLDSSDVYGVYNGTLLNNATYTSTSTTQPYIGNGRALSLSNPSGSSTNSSFVVSSFLDLSSRSFTVEGWIYSLTSYSGDNGIFGQCQCSTCSNQCLHFLVRSARLYMGFMLNDLSGTTSLVAATWYHVAFVYNYATSQQIIYLNGIQDGIKSSAQPYQGQNGPIQIGATQTILQTSYFNGYIDNIQITTRAKTASEILNDATLMAYYSFDLPNPIVDSGPNGLHGMINNAALVAGRRNQGLRFTGTNSYFQAYGFYSLAWGVVSNRPFTIALWINPSSIASSTIVQVSPFQNSTYNPAYILNLIGFWSSGSTINGQLVTQLYAWTDIFGPFLPLNTWSHVAFTFSTTRGNTQYVNGAFVGSTGAASSGNVYGTIQWLHIGYNFCWNQGYVICGGYQGSVDELYVYSRELSQTEISALATI